MTFADSIASKLTYEHDEDMRRIRAQARMRAEKLNLDPAAFAELAANARTFLDPEPALQQARRLLEAA